MNRSPADLELALKNRLRRDAARLGPRELNRIRKEIALQRLLARLTEVTPDGTWALKGGMSLVARLGPGARTTQDADASWRIGQAAFTDYLADACDLDLGDGFVFTVTRRESLGTDSPDGGERFSFNVLLAGRIFEQGIDLDISYMGGDNRPIEWVNLAVPPTEELGLGPVEVPVIPIGQQLSEKLHAYQRIYRGERSTRSRDLMDMLVIADRLAIPSRPDLAAVCGETFALRNTDWPAELLTPPDDWYQPWINFAQVYDLPWGTLDDAYDALADFWVPVLSEPRERGGWDARRWTWI